MPAGARRRSLTLSTYALCDKNTMNIPTPAQTSVTLLGVGMIAKAIPPEVYKKSTTFLLENFEALLSPFTRMADGFGLLIHQKFLNMVDAQKARRILDRLIGYGISPILRKAIGADSAGRVQSIVVKIILEREKEIRDFFKSESSSYFTFKG